MTAFEGLETGLPIAAGDPQLADQFSTKPSFSSSPVGRLRRDQADGDVVSHYRALAVVCNFISALCSLAAKAGELDHFGKGLDVNTQDLVEFLRRGRCQKIIIILEAFLDVG